MTTLSEQKNICIIGYFGHFNLGDEQYKESFDYIFHTFFPNYISLNIKYIDCDYLATQEFNTDDIIILGGGDVLNEYFLNKIILKFENKPNKIIAFSVGLPYSNILINTFKLSIFDYIFIRTKQDIELFSQYFNRDRLVYIPDISFYLLQKHKDILNQKSFIYKLTNTTERNNKKNIQIKNGGVILEMSHTLRNHKNIEPEYYVQIKKTLSNWCAKLNKKVICFSLNRHIYSKQIKEAYKDIVQAFAETIKTFISKGYYIVLLPFNTIEKDNLEDNTENDIIIHNDVCNIINYTNSQMLQKILNITDALTVKQTLGLYKYFYITVPMRFHACLFSIYMQVPMVPVFTTKKIKNQLLDIQWNHYYELDKNEKDIPIMMDTDVLNKKISHVAERYNYMYMKTQLQSANIELGIQIDNTIPLFVDIINKPYEKISTMTKSNYIDLQINKLYYKLQDYAMKTEKKHDFRLCVLPETQTNMVLMASYYLTNNFNSIYNYGLKMKMFDKHYNYAEEWKWILKNHMAQHKKIVSNPDGLFNIDFIDQSDHSGVHRSGWQYVYDNIKTLHNEKSDILMDLYIDRTFHWNYTVNKLLGLIPYKTSWVGFIHHTFDTSFSEYNNNTLLKNEDFILSVPYCKGLFVLSHYLKEQFEREFKLMNVKIPIYVLIHPTEMQNVPSFQFNRFIENKDKKIVHIGGWLRNIYSFYLLQLKETYTFKKQKCTFFKNSTSDKIKKTALRGKNMANYYPSSEIKENITALLCHTENVQNNKIDTSILTTILPNCSHNMNYSNDEIVPVTHHLRNNWNKHFMENFSNVLDNIDILQNIDNEKYDELLCENIVFINLVDASTVNTIIECIIRNTPIIVNRHPAAVELLGKNYPLFFDNGTNYIKMNIEVNALLDEPTSIYRAYKYLKHMDKHIFQIDYFIQTLKSCMKHIIYDIEQP